MTTQELLNRINVSKTSSYGHYKVTITFRNKKYNCISTNSVAYDRHLDEDSKGIYTQKEALKTFWYECKRKNNLY